MTAAVAAGLAAALSSALALNWGYVRQHGAAAALPPLEVRRPLRSLGALCSNLPWLTGFLVGIGGWVLYVVALKLAPLSLVQAVAAGGIGVLALLTWGRDGRLARRTEKVGVGFALGGLLLLGLSFVGQPVHAGHGAVLPVSIWIGASVLLVGVAASARGVRSAAAFGVGAGVLYAAGDVATKAAVGGGGRLAFVAVMLACHGLAFVLLQLGFQRGGVLATAGLCSLFTNALPIVAGMTIYREGLPGGAMGVLRVVAFVLVVAGGAGLAREERPEALSPAPATARPAVSPS